MQFVVCLARRCDFNGAKLEIRLRLCSFDSVSVPAVVDQMATIESASTFGPRSTTVSVNELVLSLNHIKRYLHRVRFHFIILE